MPKLVLLSLMHMDFFLGKICTLLPIGKIHEICEYTCQSIQCFDNYVNFKIKTKKTALSKIVYLPRSLNLTTNNFYPLNMSQRIYIYNYVFSLNLVYLVEIIKFVCYKIICFILIILESVNHPTWLCNSITLISRSCFLQMEGKM